MAKKYIGIVSGSVQKFIDHMLTYCPFCGQTTDWAAGKQENKKLQFVCPHCNGVLGVNEQDLENTFHVRPETFTVLETGNKNGNHLKIDTEYALPFLVTCSGQLCYGNQLKDNVLAPEDIFLVKKAPVKQKTRSKLAKFLATTALIAIVTLSVTMIGLIASHTLPPIF